MSVKIVVYILIVTIAIGLLPIHSAYSTEEVDYDLQQKILMGKDFTGGGEFRPDAYVTLRAEVWGYYEAGASYNRTTHKITCYQNTSDDFDIRVNNFTSYGLNSTGQVVYSSTYCDNEWLQEYYNTTSFEDDVYLAATYVDVTVFDRVYYQQTSPHKNQTWHIQMTAWVSRYDVTVTDIAASPTTNYPGETTVVTVDVKNQGAVTETFNVTLYYDNTPIETLTVSNLASEDTAELTFNWNTAGVSSGNHTLKAEASIVEDEKKTDNNIYIGPTVTLTDLVLYMQNAKWDSTYWKLLWNNTSTSTSTIKNKVGYCISGYLGVKIYKGSTCISGANVVEVGSWEVDEEGLKNVTWNCSEQNVTGTFLKVEIWYKFYGGSWTSAGVAFKTKTFGDNSTLNSTTWSIYLYGRFFIEWNPNAVSRLIFYWGSQDGASRIENIVYT